jgi:hypothetical protein
MIFTRRAVGRSLGAKTTAATSSIIGRATNAAVMTSPLDRAELTVWLPSVSGQHETADAQGDRQSHTGWEAQPEIAGHDEGPGIRSAWPVLGVRSTHKRYRTRFRSGWEEDTPHVIRRAHRCRRGRFNFVLVLLGIMPREQPHLPPSVRDMSQLLTAPSMTLAIRRSCTA